MSKSIFDNFDDQYSDDNSIEYNENICKCRHLKLIQIVAYNYIKKFTTNEHLRFVFASYALNVANRTLTCDELLNIFPYKHKLDKQI